jgi:hypothetical protein
VTVSPLKARATTTDTGTGNGQPAIDHKTP